LNQKTNGTIRKCSPRAFRWMVMSVGYNNPKFVGQFLCPTLGDRSRPQSFKVLSQVIEKPGNPGSAKPDDWFCWSQFFLV
jgi:hypothetical protein